MTATTDESKATGNTKTGPMWLVILAAIIAGIILLSDAMGWGPLVKLSARLGIALLFSAIALMIGGSKPAGIVAVAILWLGTILSFFL